MLSVRMRLFMFMRMHHSKPSQADSQGVMSDNILYNSQHLFPWKRVLYVHTQTPFASHSLSLSLSHTHMGMHKHTSSSANQTASHIPPDNNGF